MEFMFGEGQLGIVVAVFLVLALIGRSPRMVGASLSLRANGGREQTCAPAPAGGDRCGCGGRTAALGHHQSR